MEPLNVKPKPVELACGVQPTLKHPSVGLGNEHLICAYGSLANVITSRAAPASARLLNSEFTVIKVSPIFRSSFGGERQIMLAGAGLFRLWSETRVNVRCGSYEWGIRENEHREQRAFYTH